MLRRAGVGVGNVNPGLYLHIPFCTTICPYCDFYVLSDRGRHRENFLAGLLQEMELRASRPWPPESTGRFDTVYFGGGTPSLLSPRELETILEGLRTHFDLVDRPDLFLEANPEHVTAGTVQAWRALGFRHISLGVQSFDDRSLQFLGRGHDSARARRAVELLVEADLDWISVDLIYALPGQDSKAWEAELSQALDLGPSHLSCYELTIHEGTPFGFRHARGELQTVGETLQADLLLLTHEFLGARDMEGYEVSNFAASPDCRSTHNLKYWNHTPYLGLGPSAHSFASNRRWWNERKIRPWLERIESGQSPRADQENLSASDLLFESLILGFRTRAGVDLKHLEPAARNDFWNSNRDVAARLHRDGFLDYNEMTLVPTLAGLCVADTLARAFDTRCI